jgi:pyruvate/2-oxoglutarate dehydrogenase complex dihydrolipoamide acyltransferase (E2) component
VAIERGRSSEQRALLVVVESDKATHELEAPTDGILRKILVEEGSEVDVDTPLAIIADDGEPAEPVDSETPGKASPGITPLPSTTPIPTGRRPSRQLPKELRLN